MKNERKAVIKLILKTKQNKTKLASSSSSSSTRRREVGLCAHVSAAGLGVGLSFPTCFLLAAFGRITHLFKLLK